MLPTISMLALFGCTSDPAMLSESALGIDSMLDVQPPTLTLEAGWHGAVLSPGRHVITGTVSDNRADIRAVMVNGKWTPVMDGQFVIKQHFHPGVHTVRVTAVDRAGNRASESVSMIFGDVHTFDAAFDEAASVQVGQRVLDQVATAVDATVAENMGIQAGDVFSPFGECVSIHGRVDEVVAIGRDVHVSTDSVEQVLYLDVSYAQMAVAFSGRADVCGIPETFSAEFISQRPNVRVTLAPVAEEGGVGFAIEGVETTIEGYTAHMGELIPAMDDWGYTAADLRIDDTLARSLEAGLGDQDVFASEVGALFSETLPSIRLPGTAQLHTGFNAHDIVVEDYGMTVEFDAIQHRWGGVHAVAGEHWVRLAQDLPAMANADVSMAISIDTVNHALFSAWYAGKLERTTEMPWLVGSAVVQTTATMPPVLVAEQGAMRVVFSALETEVTEIRPDGEETVLATAQVFVEQQIRPDLSRSGMKIHFVDDAGYDLNEPMRRAVRAQIGHMLHVAMPNRIQVPQGYTAGQFGSDAIAQGWLGMNLNVIPRWQR